MRLSADMVQQFLKGKIKATLYDKEGGKVIWEYEGKNGITDLGIHYVLDTSFVDGGTPTPDDTWFAGLIDNDSFTGVAPGDTASSHSGWIEATAYDEATREALGFSAAAMRSISATISFTMNATKTLRGIFIIGDGTKGGTTGLLFSTALFAASPTVVSGNVLTITYTLSD